LDVNGQTTLASVNVEDLTPTRLTFAGTSGELQDDANLAWTSNTLFVTGALDVDNIKLDGNVISATNLSAGAGNLTLRPAGTGVVTIDTNRALIIASGDDLTRPTPLSVGDGAIRYNESQNRFEGTVSGSWTGLGGVVDVDQDTYIRANAADGTDTDTLVFYADGDLEMEIDTSGVDVKTQITTPIATITTATITTATIGTAGITTETVGTSSIGTLNV